MSYLKDKRGISDFIIDKFDLGFVPFQTTHQFHGRIITPIYDSYNNLIALSTKSLEIPKGEPWHFMHEDFEKRFYLYGLNNAKKNIFKYKKAILVEGEMDTLFLHSLGFDIAVGLCGSAFSIYHSALLARYCKEVYIVLDGDRAGRDSKDRIKQIFKDYNFSQYDMKYMYVNLPEGYDPDDFIKEKGKKSFKNLLINSR